MKKQIFALCLVAALAVSCASKKKAEDAAGDGSGAGDATPTPSVSDSPINFDAQGSDSGKIAGLNTIYFEYDKSSLSSSMKQKLSENAKWIKNNANSTIQIEGHCDARGSAEYNIALGERRARSVKSYLVSMGVDAKKMTIISYGKEKPVVMSESEDAYSKNRRANFVPLQN